MISGLQRLKAANCIVAGLVEADLCFDISGTSFTKNSNDTLVIYIVHNLNKYSLKQLFEFAFALSKLHNFVGCTNFDHYMSVVSSLSVTK